MRLMRIFSVCVIAMMIASLATTAAAGTSLRGPTDTSGSGTGWTFLLLSGIAFAVAANGISERDEELEGAETRHDEYNKATTSAEAASLRGKTNRHLDRAKSFESTANAALTLGVLFLLTSYASFTNEAREGPILISHRGIAFRYRF